MTISAGRALAMILLSGAITYTLRALPFLAFGGERKMPRLMQRLAVTLPPAIMAALVVYCLKALPTQSATEWLPTVSAVAVVVTLHLWKRNTILSVFGGTACYMLLLQLL